MKIDLRSDTCTLPTQEMRNAIYHAGVGDQAYGEDQITLELERYCANLFGKEAALFMPSGTMSDQVAIKTWTTSGEEVILDESYHVNYFQTGSATSLANVCLSTVSTEDGLLTPENIEEQMRKRMKGAHFPNVGLVLIENTINYHSGKIYPFELIERVFSYCQAKKIPLHIDGERILNACVALNIDPAKFGSVCDSLSCSFSKGLGGPFGSILMGSKEFIQKAERYRRWYGGFMHQTGFMAAAALYAIKNNISILENDHINAKILCEELKDNDYVEVLIPETNIVMIDISKLELENSKIFVEKCIDHGVYTYPWSKNTVRAIVHLDISEEDIMMAATVINSVANFFGKKGQNKP